MGALKLVHVTHYRIGTMTACGLRGVEYRNIATTTDQVRVSCKPCRRRLEKERQRA